MTFMNRIRRYKILFLILKIAYWLATPHRTAARIRFLKAKQRENRYRIDLTAGHFPGAANIHLSKARANAQQWCTPIAPDVSILIINWNAEALTQTCIQHIWAHTDNVRYEIIIVDNGSREEEIAPLRHLGAGVRLLELGRNRFFGEANNIAAEAANGRYLCLLNNDAFVQPGWLNHLVFELESDKTIGAVGPLFLFPDGSIQEAGAMIDNNGYPNRFGRHYAKIHAKFLKPMTVDYISAATLLFPRDIFMAAGGFDLQYEPVYYEDVDLCFKIHALGKTIRYCPHARVIHIECASTRNAEDEARRGTYCDINRQKFLSRWGKYLNSRKECDLEYVREQLALPVIPQSTKTSLRKSAVIFTPYALTPGGGERYLLTIASILQSEYVVSIVTSHPYSQLRLHQLAHALNLKLSPCKLFTTEQFTAMSSALMITLGNHILPSIPGRAMVNLFLCQFPFKMTKAMNRAWLNTYQSILCYSEYSKAHIFTALSAEQLPTRPTHVLYPPVQHFKNQLNSKKHMILSVGRFFTGAHCKRHDLLIIAFQKLYKRLNCPIELHFAGSSFPEEPVHMDYLNQLRHIAKKLPIQFHINIATNDLATLYRDAAIYWHATGLESDLYKNPENAEHFGISIVEAMSAGCVPFAFNSGGPREIISDGINGFLYASLDELISKTLPFFHENNLGKRNEMSQAAICRANDFSYERFTQSLQDLIKKQTFDCSQPNNLLTLPHEHA